MYLHTCINSSFGRCIFAAKTYCNPIMERLDEILEIVREIREDIAYMKRHRNMLCGTPILEVSEVCDLLKISDRQLRRYCVSGQLTGFPKGVPHFILPLETGREGTQERYGIKNAPGQSARYGYHPHRKIMKVRPLLILLLFVVSTGILVWIYFAALRGQRAPHRRQWTETLADLDACCRHKHIKSRQYDHFAETARAEQRPGAEQLFRAMAFSARLHEYNCANAIVRLGGRYTPLEKVTVFRGTTDQNLQRSIDFERRTPDAPHAGEIDRALAAGNRYAARVLIWSKAGDVRHRALMARYIATGETGHEAGYRICPVCGNIYAAEYCDPFCPQCQTDGREFVRIGE